MKSILIALTIFPIVALSQNDPQADAILGEMSKVNNAYSSISASFDYTLNNQAAGVTDTREGSVALSKGKFHLNLGDYKVNADGQVVWVTMTDLEEVQIYDYQEFKEDNDFDPSEIFSGYSKGFKTKFMESTTIGNSKVDVIDLYPEDPSTRSFSRIRLFVESGSRHLKQAKVFGKDGNLYTYLVKSFSVNEDLSKVLSSFNQQALEEKGFSVEDLR